MDAGEAQIVVDPRRAALARVKGERKHLSWADLAREDRVARSPVSREMLLRRAERAESREANLDRQMADMKAYLVAMGRELRELQGRIAEGEMLRFRQLAALEKLVGPLDADEVEATDEAFTLSDEAVERMLLSDE